MFELRNWQIFFLAFFVRCTCILDDILVFVRRTPRYFALVLQCRGIKYSDDWSWRGILCSKTQLLEVCYCISFCGAHYWQQSSIRCSRAFDFAYKMVSSANNAWLSSCSGMLDSSSENWIGVEGRGERRGGKKRARPEKQNVCKDSLARACAARNATVVHSYVV